jgi:hypothetical protein
MKFLTNMKIPRIRSTTVAGGGSFALAVMVLLMIYIKPELADNDLFKILAQAIVIQGLIGLVLPFYYTAKERPPTHHGPSPQGDEM